MKVVDAHVHVGHEIFFDIHAGLGEVVSAGRALGYAAMCVTHLTSLLYDMEEGNRQLAADMRQYPDFVIGLATIPATRFDRDGVAELDRCRHDYGMRAVKLHAAFPHLARTSIDGPGAVAIVARAAELDMPLLIHMNATEAASLARQVPRATLLMAHMGGTASAFGDWQEAIDVARMYPNIYLETSSSCVDRGMLEAAVAAVGAERVIYGSDTPLLEPRVQLARVLGANLNDTDRTLILAGNLLRLLGSCASSATSQ
jgi:predicted TIM-barrel fold metal-dependent hydrolase